MPESDANEIWDLSPIPMLMVSPGQIIQRVSNGLLRAWASPREDFIDLDMFGALFGTSPMRRFDKIPLAHAIEVAVASRAFQFCQAAYRRNDSTWSARVIPIFRNETEMLSLMIEWEMVQSSTKGTGEIIQSMMPADEMFRLLIESVKDYAIFLLDTQGYVATWNTGAELLKGFKKEEIIGRHFSTFYGEDDLKTGKPEKELVQCLREGRVQDEGWRYRKDGSRFWALVVITALYRNGVHVGFGKVTRDLSERRENELRLISAYEESSKLKNDFLANVSHEIRTPMHGMLSACSLLLDTDLAQDQRETANTIAESGQVLMQVINGILDYSKLASGNFSINMDLVGVSSIVASVVRNAQMALFPGVYMKLVLAPDLPKSTQGDPLRFRQILQNLVDNAVKFTERGLILVQVSIDAEDDRSYTIRTEVTDTGIGVADDVAHILFKPFTQLDMPNNKRFQGTGLGLSIAKALAKLLGGQLGYRPNPHHQGSVFWFTAKFTKVVREQLDSIETIHGEETEKCLELSDKEKTQVALNELRRIAPRKRVLAAEDNAINQKVLFAMLRAFNFQDVTLASNGEEAASIVEKSPESFDLVLMDISMPVLDGFEATSRIRKAGVTVPVIAMTAYALRGDMETCLERGMNDYIPKPVNKNAMMSKLLRWLEEPGKQPDGLHMIVNGATSATCSGSPKLKSTPMLNCVDSPWQTA
ncbi:Two-component system protein A [Escovopsis weberi]|uniref:Two-component system protein A n=1 Tax=Escovopsis weberi TaxID=150374 RepID=A0A0M8MZE6_ESCWE|nr:Two-component system protein A [Escovopsis weberi]